MLRCKLVKVRVLPENRVRTPEVEGTTENIPEKGHPFVMFAPPLEAGDLRMVNTTKVQSVEYNAREQIFLFETENSCYRLEVLDNADPFKYSRWRKH